MAMSKANDPLGYPGRIRSGKPAAAFGTPEAGPETPGPRGKNEAKRADEDPDGLSSLLE